MFSRQNILQYANYLLFSFVVIGIGLAAYGGYQYYDNTQKINELDERREAIKDAIAGSSTQQLSDPEGLFYSDIARRRERNEAAENRNLGIRLAGVGVICIAAAWLGRDFAAAYRRRLAQREA